jgi:hypothetical protein
MMGFKYAIGEHLKRDEVQTLQDGILKMNHLLFNELFKMEETCMCWG